MNFTHVAGVAAMAAGMACSEGLTPPIMFRPGIEGGWVVSSAGVSATLGGNTVTLAGGDAHVQVRFKGARPAAHPAPCGTAGARIRVISASAQEQFTAYRDLCWTNLYPGIDAVYESGKALLKSTFVIRPGADPERILMHISGHRGLTVNGAGDLVIHAGSQEFIETRPEVYQDIDGVRRPVSARFRVDRDLVSFEIAKWDKRNALVIDPVLTTRTGAEGADIASAVAIDDSGYIYAAGYSDSPTLPGAAKKPGGVDAFVAKWTPGARSLVYCTWIGGSLDDRAFAIAVNQSGEAFVAGQTTSFNLPLAAANRTSLSGAVDAFFVRLDAVGGLAWSTYWGGSGVDRAAAVAVDPAGNAYFAGSSASTDMPVGNAFQSRNAGNADAFIVKFSAGTATVAYSTYLGGQYDDAAAAIAVDKNGNAVITGRTWSPNFPVAAAARSVSRGLPDAFVTKLTAAGNQLVYSTYVGGGSAGFSFEGGTAVAVDADGDAYVAGVTDCWDFPVFPASSAPATGGQDGFLMRLSTGGGVVYSRILGGSNRDEITGIAIVSSADVFVGGFTASVDFPSASEAPVPIRNYEGFLSRLSKAGELRQTQFIQGSQTDVVNAIAAKRRSAVAFVGQTASADIAVNSVSGSPGMVDALVGVYAVIPRDFDANGVSDLLLQNEMSGTISFWYLGGALGSTLLSAPEIATPVPGWKLAAAADFDRDGHPDLLLQNTAAGAISVWYMTGPQSSAIRQAPIIAYPVPGWLVAAAEDFDSDGVPDLVLRNGNTVSVWFMGGPYGGTLQLSREFVAGTLSAEFVAAADFTGDGIPDLVFREPAGNELVLWPVLGGRAGLATAAPYSLGTAAPGWDATGWGDFDTNGCPDLLLVNEPASLVSIWYYGGATCHSRLSAPIVRSKAAGWRLRGIR